MVGRRNGSNRNRERGTWFIVCLVAFVLLADYRIGRGEETVFFAFDDHHLAWKHNLRLNLNPPSKHPENPVLRCGPKGSPDYGHAILYGSVLRIDGKFRMWYLGMIQRELDRGQAPGWWRPMCYAESDDGIHWTKPELNLVELNGNRKNNICLIEGEPASMTLVNDFLSVIHEPDEPDPARRYKCAYIAHMPDKDIRGGMSRVGIPERRVGAIITATSADGLTWKCVGDRPVNAGGERFEVSGLYRFGSFYYATGQLASPWSWLDDGREVGRMTMAYRSPDFVHWSRAKATAMVLPQQSLDPQRGYAQLLGGDGKQMHMGFGLWNRGNVLVGLHGIWQGRPEGAKGLEGLKIDLGLCLSNDGVHWRDAFPGKVYLPHGKEGEWDSIALLQGHAFVNVGDLTYLWYSHWDCEGGFRSQEIGLATVRRDGFASLQRHDAGDPGHVVSTLVTPRADSVRIRLNVAGVSPDAPVQVELLDARDQPFAGYSGEDAARVSAAGTATDVTWKRGPEIDVDTPFAVRVTLPDSDQVQLFAIYVDGANP